MRMHRAAKVRHNKTVEECIVTPKYRDAHPQQFHIQFDFSGEATSLLTLTRSEAKELFETLGVKSTFGAPLDEFLVRLVRVSAQLVARPKDVIVAINFRPCVAITCNLLECDDFFVVEHCRNLFAFRYT